MGTTDQAMTATAPPSPVDFIRPGIRQVSDELLTIAGGLVMAERDRAELQPDQVGRIGDRLAALGRWLDTVAAWTPPCPCKPSSGGRRRS